MKESLKRILLIDDNTHDNYFHSRVIRKAGVAQEVISVQSAEDAIKYLQTPVEGEYPQPDLIFLDINMPSMNGWEFLEEYQQFAEGTRGKVVIVMLTTSELGPDKQKAEKHPQIDDFKNKPLNQQKLTEILETNFPDLF